LPHIFYASRVDGETVVFDEEEVHHLRVVRAEPGEVVEASDGKGKVYRVRLCEIKKRLALGKVLEIKEARPQLIPQVIAFVGASRWQRMRLVVEKGVELGVVAFAVYKGDLSYPGGGKEDKEKYLRTAIEAMKQSGNVWLPSISFFSSLEEALEQTRFTVLLVADMKGDDPSKVLLKSSTQPIAVVIGPQEGLSQREKDLLKARGAIFLKLSDNILRMETAFIVLVALILHSVR